MSEGLTPVLILGIIGVYFVLLLIISYFTGKKSDNATFFLANRNSPWFVVAFGMIGASLSGVTFISIPGVVGGDGLNQAFSYMQIVLGYLLGYVVIAQVLLPLYYKLQLTTIYGYLGQRFGPVSYKTGSAYFLLSRTIGSSFRLFLVAIVLYHFVLSPFGISFLATVAITILLIWVYTFRGGIKTIVYTDTLQTFCMLTAVILTVYVITSELSISGGEMVQIIRDSGYGQVFFFEGGWADPNNFFKQFFSGALITIVMTGLDQDMMQKNLTCRSLRDAKKNMYTFSFILVFANLLFLTLGAMLYIYAGEIGVDIPGRTDELYPMLALQFLPAAVGIMFVIGLIASAYSSADSGLTALTTAFCVDFLGFKSEENGPSVKKKRMLVHIGFSLVLLLMILMFNALNNDAVINGLFKAAGYTYGPLLGLFAFGLFTKRVVIDKWVIWICLASPVLSFLLDFYSTYLFAGFQFGFLILAANGLLTFTGLYLISRNPILKEDPA
nr:sodium:solute symporter [Saprospiraceae bacterium]